MRSIKFEKDRSADIVGWFFLAALAFAPFIYGANVALAWGLNALAFGVLLTLYAGLHAIRKRPLPVPPHRFSDVAVMVGVVMGWIFLQTQSWVPSALHAPVWREASQMLGQELPGAISVNPGATSLGLLRLATEAAVFLLALQLGRDARWATRIVLAIAAAGACYAVGALLFKALGPQISGLILPKPLVNLYPSSPLIGPFINRDHFAIYLGIAMSCAWAALVGDMAKRLALQDFHDHRELLAKALAISASLGRYAVLLMPIVIALLLTASRAGFLLTVVAVLVIAALAAAPLTEPAAYARRKRRRNGVLLKQAAPMAIAIVGVAVALAAHGDTLTGRLIGSSVEGDLHPRLAVARVTMRAIQDQPLLGHGYGTFVYTFPPFRDQAVMPDVTWREAHNSYLEALLGLGIPVALTLFAGLATIVFRCGRAVITRRRDRLAPVAALAATVIMALHALVDFSIQIEGIALTYAALLGAGLAQSWSSRAP
jgi:O-antigen ligase